MVFDVVCDDDVVLVEVYVELGLNVIEVVDDDVRLVEGEVETVEVMDEVGLTVIEVVGDKV